jgi:hypothetical protein
MLASAIFAVLAVPSAASATYTIVEIDRESHFAGRLGQRVHEKLVVESDGQRYTVDIRGDYHTRCVRPWQRLKEGDEVRLPDLRDRSSVARDQISRVR